MTNKEGWKDVVGFAALLVLIYLVVMASQIAEVARLERVSQ